MKAYKTYLVFLIVLPSASNISICNARKKGLRNWMKTIIFVGKRKAYAN